MTISRVALPSLLPQKTSQPTVRHNRNARLGAGVAAVAWPAAPDSWAGGTISHAAVATSLELRRSNLAMLTDTTLASPAYSEANVLQRRADGLLAQARDAVKHVAGQRPAPGTFTRAPCIVSDTKRTASIIPRMVFS